METHQHFGLNAAPFEGRPDPRFYYAAAGHAEALAALQYSVHSGKSCTIVLGEPGSGKTLLGHVLLREICRKTLVGWVQGLGRDEQQTEITVCPRLAKGQANPLAHPKAKLVNLADWSRNGLPASPATAVIVDDADALSQHGWQDILSLMSREVRARGPLTLILLGLPKLLDVLAEPALVRVQRRVFRTCRLTPLSRNEIGDYVRHRSCVAGGDGREVFTAAALDLIHRFSNGNPALVNQLCDNAMVEAFGEDRHVIDARHVVGTVQAITGGIRRRRYFPSPAPLSHQLAAPEETGVRARLRQALAEAGSASFSQPPETEQEPAEIVSQAPAAEPEDSEPLETGEMPTPEPAEPPECDLEELTPQAFEDENPLPTDGDPDEFECCQVEEPPVDERLRALGERLSAAIARVREARRQPLSRPQTASGSPLPMDAREADDGASDAQPARCEPDDLARESTP